MVTWGDRLYGGDSSSVQELLRNLDFICDMSGASTELHTRNFFGLSKSNTLPRPHTFFVGQPKLRDPLNGFHPRGSGFPVEAL